MKNIRYVKTSDRLPGKTDKPFPVIRMDDGLYDLCYGFDPDDDYNVIRDFKRSYRYWIEEFEVEPMSEEESTPSEDDDLIYQYACIKGCSLERTPKNYPKCEGHYVTSEGKVYFDGEYWRDKIDGDFVYPRWFFSNAAEHPPLPSDEEIDQAAEMHYMNYPGETRWVIIAFKEGIKWLRNKLNQ